MNWKRLLPWADHAQEKSEIQKHSEEARKAHAREMAYAEEVKRDMILIEAQLRNVVESRRN